MAFKKGNIPWNKGGTSWRKGLGDLVVVKEGNRRRNTRYRDRHPERIKAAQLAWYNQDPVAARKKKADYMKNRRATNLNYRIMTRLRGRLSDAVRGRCPRGGSHVVLLGCSVEFLKQHLESQFKEGMSWENYGRSGWWIDHIIPLSLFDLSDPEQLKRLCHYTNLQPLWRLENIIKSNKLEYASN